MKTVPCRISSSTLIQPFEESFITIPISTLKISSSNMWSIFGFFSEYDWGVIWTHLDPAVMTDVAYSTFHRCSMVISGVLGHTFELMLARWRSQPIKVRRWFWPTRERVGGTVWKLIWVFRLSKIGSLVGNFLEKMPKSSNWRDGDNCPGRFLLFLPFSTFSRWVQRPPIPFLLSWCLIFFLAFFKTKLKVWEKSFFWTQSRKKN